MNYRHAFHAGNHADALKHAVLLALLDALKRKDSPFFVLDTHAGRGRYELSAEESRKTSEAETGIGKLRAATDLPGVLQRYVAAASAHGEGVYPGSPLLVASELREHDRLAACELQPEDAAARKALFAGEPRVAVHQRDGYSAIRALLPPKHADKNGGTTKFARGLVLIDPPYEAQDAEYPLVAAALAEGLQRWPAATYAVWYPVKQRRSLQPFFRSAAALPAKSALVAELLVRPDDSPLRLNGSGMLLLNPPWQVETVAASVLESLRGHLGEPGASVRLEWLREAA